MNALRKLAGLLLLALMVAGSVSGQSGQQAPPTPAPAEPAAPPVNQEEEKDYQAFFETARMDAPRQAQLGEAFVVKYPESRYRESVYTRLTNVYLSLGDVKKLAAAGGKALEINPDNVDVLSVMAYALPRDIRPSELDAPQRLKKVEEYSTHAIELLNQMVKPEPLSEEDFTRAKNEKLSMAYSGLGLVQFRRADYTGMAESMELATTLTATPDPSDFYLLGISYQQLRRFSDAATTFGKCAAMDWQNQDACKQSRAEAEKQAALQPKN